VQKYIFFLFLQNVWGNNFGTSLNPQIDVCQGAKGLAASMTQDQATEMNGFLNNGLLFWRDIAGNTGLILASLTNQHTTDSAELMRNYAQNALAHLANIDNNTGRLEAIERDISGINAGIDRMTT
jgi:hypothetical protein